MLTKNTKIAIDKTLTRIPAKRLGINFKSWEDEVKFINKGIAASVLFKDISISGALQNKIVKRLKSKVYPDFTKLPFNDFCILTDLVIEAAGENNVRAVKQAAMLIRYTRSKVEKDVILVTTYIKTDVTSGFLTMNIKALDTVTHKFDLLAYDKEFKKQVIDKSPTILNSEMSNALLNFAILQQFEPEKIPYTPTFSERKHIPSNMKDKYFEYTLNLTKPLKAKWSRRKPLGGSHASPCEHTRRGHYRTYKSGKRVWVEGMSVNKGSSTGKIEKDYSLQAS